MKTIFIVFLIASVLGALKTLLITERKPSLPYLNAFNKPVATCGSGFGITLADTSQPRIVPGLGNMIHEVTTSSPLAQDFFNQGLRYIYAFNHSEAVRSFRAALMSDPACAMAYWGIAHAYGPNINMPMTKEAEKMAFDAIQRAKALRSRVSARDAAYIDALSLRYRDTGVDRTMADSAYIGAMKQLAETYTDDPDAATLYADALMNTFAWQYWEKDKSFKPQARKVLGVLEGVISKHPGHAGAHHLLLHLVEGSDQPARGLKSAVALDTLMPRAGHIVHMPSHIYIRTGNFDLAAKSNIKAIAVDESIYGNSLPEGAYAMYYGHNIHFLYFTANMLGQKYLSIETARKLAAKVQTDQLESNPFAQEFSNVSYYSYIRFGLWDEMLAQPAPSGRLPYMQSMWHFGRGLAYLRKDNLELAKRELDLLDSLSNLKVLKSIYTSLDPVSSTVTIATALLQGEIQLAEGRTEAGLATLRKTVNMEDQLIYNEPPTWPIPVRQFLGAALLEANNYKEAEKIYREDLDRHPENGWSLFGLYKALEARAGQREAAQVLKRFDEAWSSADINLVSSRF